MRGSCACDWLGWTVSCGMTVCCVAAEVGPGSTYFCRMNLNCFVPTPFFWQPCCCHVWWKGSIQINDRPACFHTACLESVWTSACSGSEQTETTTVTSLAQRDIMWIFVPKDDSKKHIYPVLVSYIPQEFVSWPLWNVVTTAQSTACVWKMT